MIDEISVDTPCDLSEKLRLIVSKDGANSVELGALGSLF